MRLVKPPLLRISEPYLQLRNSVCADFLSQRSNWVYGKPDLMRLLAFGVIQMINFGPSPPPPWILFYKMNSIQKRNYETYASNLLLLTMLLGIVINFYKKIGLFGDYGPHPKFFIIGLFILISWYLLNAFLIRKGIKWVKVFVLIAYLSYILFSVVMNIMGKENFTFYSNPFLLFLQVSTLTVQIVAIVLICVSLQRPQTTL